MWEARKKGGIRDGGDGVREGEGVKKEKKIGRKKKEVHYSDLCGSCH